MDAYATDSCFLRKADAAGGIAVDSRAWLAVVAAAVAGMAVQALWIPVDADVSWLITVCERLLSGDHLYVTIFETNPPASVWLYLPLVWLASEVGAKPEAVVVGAFAAAGIASVMTTVRLASRLDRGPDPLFLAGALGLITLVFPMALFAEREHAALLLVLPALASLAVIAEGKALGKRAVFASGAAAGLVIVIKPYFVAAILGPALWAAYRRRSLSPIVPGMVAASAVVVVYGAAIALFASAYFAYLPLIAGTYAPMHNAWWKVLVGPVLYPALYGALAILLRPERIPSLAIAWVLGGAGFILAAIVQAKGYPNHWLPGAALVLAAAFAVVAQSAAAPARKAVFAAGLGLVALFEMYGWAILPDPAVAAAIERVAPPSPTILSLSPELTTGHPVTRNVGGRWVGSRAGLFTAVGARFVGLDKPAARRAYDEDIQSFAMDVGRHSPEVILVDRGSKKWLMREPAVASTMRAYRRAAITKETEIWVRRSPAH